MHAPAVRLRFVRSLPVVLALALICQGLAYAGASSATPRYQPNRTNPERSLAAKSARIPSPGTTVGPTWYDIQHNGATGRQIGIWNDTILVAWTQGFSNSPSDRQVAWNRAVVTGPAQTVALDNGDMIDVLPLNTDLSGTGIGISTLPFGSGYTNLGLYPGTGESLVLCHGGGELQVRIDEAHEGTFFPLGLIPTSPSGAAGTPLWPKGAVSVDHSGGPDTILHVVAQSSADGLFARIWYWRGEVLRVVAGAGGWIVAWDPGSPVTVDSSANVGYVLATDPNSDRVAIVWSRPINYANTGFDAQELNNAVYMESTDAGQSWTGPTFITNNPNMNPAAPGYYVFADLDALYDDNNNLHVVYTARRWDGSNFQPGDVVLQHWDQASNTLHTIEHAQWTNPCAFDLYGVGVYNMILAKPSVAFKPAGVGPFASEVLYAAWTQFGPTQSDCSDGPLSRTNAEIYYCASTDGGVTWGSPINVTGTETPNCAEGNCLSEHWVTAAARADEGLYLSYVEDTDAGTSPQGEGAWSEGSYKVLALATGTPDASGRLTVGPIDPPTWQDPYWTNRVIDIPEPATGDPVSAQIDVGNLGNATLNFTATVMPDAGGPSFVTVNGGATYSSSIVPTGASEVITIDIDPNGYEGLAEFRVQFTNDGSAAHRSVSATGRDTVDLLFRVPGLPIIICPITLTGDINLSGTITSADIIAMVGYVFKSGAEPLPCVAAGDVNCSGTVTSADVIALVNFVFKGGAPPCDACTSPLASGC